MSYRLALAALAALFALPCSAETPAPPSADASGSKNGVDPRTNGALPAGTEVFLSMEEDLTTLGGQISVGHPFRLMVAKDVRIGDYVIIPRGTPAVGEVTWLTGKGMFGKSGKMEVALRYIDLNGRRIPLLGTYRQEGRGNTVATAAGVAAVGVFGGVITGRSASIPSGKEIRAYTQEPLPVAFPAQ